MSQKNYERLRSEEVKDGYIHESIKVKLIITKNLSV